MKIWGTHVYRIGNDKDGKQVKTFDALEWLAAMSSHIPNKGEQMVRYYGYYSNVARGKRKKSDSDDVIHCIEQPAFSAGDLRRNWARLIQKIYEVDPLQCPACNGAMRVVAFIEDEQVVRKILKHLDLWDDKRKPEPRANAPPRIFPADDIPSFDDILADPVYPVDAYF